MKFILIITLTLCLRVLYGQDITVIYEATSKPNAMLLETVPLTGADIKTYKYSLTIKDGKSKFSRDSVYIKNIASGATEYWCFENLYKDYRNDLWIKNSGTYLENKGYQRNLSDLLEKNNFSWTKTGRSKKIVGIECVEVKFKDRVAWYAPSIPISDGPQYGIFGLKGLVMEYDIPSGKWLAVDILFTADNFEIPMLELSNIEQKIKLTYDEIKGLASHKRILINNQSPLNEWIRF